MTTIAHITGDPTPADFAPSVAYWITTHGTARTDRQPMIYAGTTRPCPRTLAHIVPDHWFGADDTIAVHLYVARDHEPMRCIARYAACREVTVTLVDEVTP